MTLSLTDLISAPSSRSVPSVFISSPSKTKITACLVMSACNPAYFHSFIHSLWLFSLKSFFSDLPKCLYNDLKASESTRDENLRQPFKTLSTLPSPNYPPVRLRVVYQHVYAPVLRRSYVRTWRVCFLPEHRDNITADVNNNNKKILARNFANSSRLLIEAVCCRRGRFNALILLGGKQDANQNMLAISSN